VDSSSTRSYVSICAPFPKRIDIAEAENHIATLTLRTPAGQQVDVTQLIRGKPTLALTISGQANSSATIAKAALDIQYSRTAPQATPAQFISNEYHADRIKSL
jgi:hypothetical protein